MEISIVKTSFNDKRIYGQGCSETTELSLLDLFLTSDFGLGGSSWEAWIEAITDPEHDLSGNITYLESKGGMIYVYYLYDEEYKNCFKTTYEKFMKLLSDWMNICREKPREIIIKKAGDKVTFEGRFFESKFDSLDFKKCTFTRLSEENICNIQTNKIRIKDKEIDVLSGFHSGLEKNKDSNNIEIVNEISLKNKTKFANFVFKENFYVNHAFFPEDWSVKKIKKEILSSLKQGFLRVIEVNDLVLSMQVLTDDDVCIKLFINIKGEIIAAYSISRDD